VRGDNAAISRDSRSFGGIATEAIRGQVKLVIYSLHSKTFLLKAL
jgi:hypothetical protein